MIDWQAILDLYGQRHLFLTSRGRLRYSDFIESIHSNKERADLVSLSLEWDPVSFARLFGALNNRASVILDEDSRAMDISAFSRDAPLLILRSGGTTGKPKHVVHSFERLLKPFKIEPRDPRRILVLYAPDHIAGIDAFLQAIHRGSTLVVPDGTGLDAIGQAIETHQVEILPCTPSLLQFLLLGGMHESYSLESVRLIPHGAERMPSRLRAKVKKVLPHARLLHRFGITELGALPVKSDPADPDALILDAHGYAWKLEGGEIMIRCATRFLGTLEDGPVNEDLQWYRSGDFGEYTDSGSLRILGRRESMINVGGEKILPEIVEEIMLGDRNVRDVLVYAVPHPLTGQTVAAKVIFAEQPDPGELLRRTRRALLDKGYSLAHIPTHVLPVTEISKSRTGKRIRAMESLDFDE